MIRIVQTKRLGLVVFTATITVEGRLHLESVHVSEHAARSWISTQLAVLARQAQVAA